MIPSEVTIHSRPEHTDVVPDPVEAVQLPSGEVIPTVVTAAGGVDKILRGYLTTARTLGPELAAKLYSQAYPNSNLDSNWFDRNKNLI